MRSRSVVSLAVAAVVSPLLSPSLLLAQGPVPATPAVRLRAISSGTVVLGQPMQVSELMMAEELQPGQDPAAAGQDPNAAAAAAAGQARVQRWKQLQFDRRPSTILQAWSAPELKPYDPAEEKAKEAKEKAGQQPPSPAAGAAPTEVVEVDDEPSREEIERIVMEQLGGAGQPAAVPPGAAVDPAAAAAAAAAQLADKKLGREFEMLQRDVTLGRWHKVGEFLLTLPEPERKGCYEHLLRVLPNHPQRPEDQRLPPNLQEKNRFAFEDAFALAALAPGGFDKKQVPMLAPLVQRAIEAGSVLEELVRQLEVETKKPAAEQRLDRREAAILLATIGQEVELGAFLPTAADAERDNDREGLNLLARHALAMHQKEKKNSWLETAWQVTQAALAQGEIEEAEKVQALRRAVELAPKVREDLGPSWLGESFSKRPERGMEIVSTIGGQVAKGFTERPGDIAYRASGLRLQKTAVDALLKDAPQLAEQWRPTLGLLASGWIVEAAYSYANSQSDSFGPMMERDDFGNIFWSNRRRGGGGQVQAVEPVDLLEAQPGPQWAALLDASLQPHFATVSAQLWLKVSEPQKAFPFIEQLAALNPRKAKDLAHEFLRVWMRNNNPNTESRTNSYMFMYGFDQRSNGIPLTRSKQDRNLQELGSWVERLRQLPIGGVDQKLLGEAFVAAHSSAEVYRLDTIERVFGDVDQLDPVLLGDLLGKMRTNLATVWRRPDVQEQQKTRRNQKQMIEQVGKGYETAITVAQGALQARGPHWALLSVMASLLHDANNFAREQQRSTMFAEARKQAFALFAEGAAHYASVADGLRLDEETLAAFDAWFYAALGASDLGAVDEETVLAKSQLPLIKQAIEALPKGSRERHMTMFANAMFTRMSAVRPQIKYRYLEAGFAICGDHPQAAEAKKVWDYYQDLIKELRLAAVVDGPLAVGTEPFGVRVDIVHSEHIERESGGFQKYATNQNNMQYGWNYGRPLENYRDKFQEAVQATLEEHFEVLSVTFNSEGMESRYTDSSDWKATSYAYLLLKARGPQVDRIPEIKLDLDFNDTSGFTVLPIGGSTVAIDASVKAEPRPFQDLEVTQLLDERRLDEGKVTLEIKARCKGLVPDLDAILELDLPGFKISKRDDQGASVTKFAEDQETVESERVWLLQLAPATAGDRPGRFVFGTSKLADTKVIYQRYDDADLTTVSADVALTGFLRGTNPPWIWVLLGVAFVGYFLWFLFMRPAPSVAATTGPLLQMPEHVTAFTVLALLRQLGAQRRLDPARQQALAADIARIEASHFGRTPDPALDLAATAERWLRSAG
ncbi:MAG: hypothetical protein MUC36_00055 [Planctomycetes bacterium]|jgi:hypothetical protein|nr:hypothetical protein [Planctomycetota bacterium]